MGEEHGDRLLRRSTSEGGVDVVAPKLETQSTHMGGRDSIGYAGDLKVEGSNGEVGRLGVPGDESS